MSRAERCFDLTCHYTAVLSISMLRQWAAQPAAWQREAAEGRHGPVDPLESTCLHLMAGVKEVSP
jgi:hypothetical protein